MCCDHDPRVDAAEADAWYAEMTEHERILEHARALGIVPRDCGCEECCRSARRCPAVLTDLQQDIADRVRADELRARIDEANRALWEARNGEPLAEAMATLAVMRVTSTAHRIEVEARFGGRER